MTAKTYYYARASSVLPPVYQQVEAFQKDGADNSITIVEKASGRGSEWPEYQAMKNLLYSGDTLVIPSLASLGRNKKDIKDELEYYRSHGIRICVLDIPSSSFEPAEGQEWALGLVNNVIIEMLACHLLGH